MFITTRVAVLLSIDIISHIAVSWNTKISFKFNPFPSRINNYVHVRLYLVNDGQFFLYIILAEKFTMESDGTVNLVLQLQWFQLQECYMCL